MCLKIEEIHIVKREEAINKKRQHILEVSALCFLRNGFHKTSIRDIAKAAGISLGNLYNHFASKDELIAEISVLESQDLEGILKQLTTNQDSFVAITKFSQAYFKYVSKPENALLGAEIAVEAMRNESVATGFKKNRGQMTKAVAAQLSNKNDDSAQKSASATAELIIDLIEGAAIRAAFAKSAEKKEIGISLLKAVEKLLD